MKKSDLRHIIRRIIREQKNRIPDKPFIPKPIGPISTDLPQSPLAPAGATPVDCRKLTQYAFDYGDATMTPYQFCVKCSTGSIVDDYCDCCISGCTDSEALNYNSEAILDDGSCEYEDPITDKPEIPIRDIDPEDEDDTIGPIKPEDPIDLSPDDEITTIDPNKDISPKKGCTNPMALNYDPDASIDDGSCEFPERPVGPIDLSPGIGEHNSPIKTGLVGCTNENAINYNPQAEIACNVNNPNDNCCVFRERLEENPFVEPDNPESNYLCEFCPYSYQGNGGGYYYPVPDNANSNFINIVTGLDSPNYEGVADPSIWSNGWPVAMPAVLAAGNINEGNCATHPQMLQEIVINSFIPSYNEYCGLEIPENTLPPGIPGCTYSGANNYNPEATVDDGSCDYSGQGEQDLSDVSIGDDIDELSYFQEMWLGEGIFSGPCMDPIFGGTVTGYGMCAEQETGFLGFDTDTFVGGLFQGNVQNNETIWGTPCGEDCWIEQFDDWVTGPVQPMMNDACTAIAYVEWVATSGLEIADVVDSLINYLSYIPGAANWVQNNIVNPVMGENLDQVATTINTSLNWLAIASELENWINETVFDQYALEFNCDTEFNGYGIGSSPPTSVWAGLWDDEGNDIFSMLMDEGEWQDFGINPYLQGAEFIVELSCMFQDLGCGPGWGWQNPNGPGGCSSVGCSCCASPIWGLCNGTYTPEELADHYGYPPGVFYGDLYSTIQEIGSNAFPFCLNANNFHDAQSWEWCAYHQQGSIGATFNYIGGNVPCGSAMYTNTASQPYLSGYCINDGDYCLPYQGAYGCFTVDEAIDLGIVELGESKQYKLTNILKS